MYGLSIAAFNKNHARPHTTNVITSIIIWLHGMRIPLLSKYITTQEETTWLSACAEYNP